MDQLEIVRNANLGRKQAENIHNINVFITNETRIIQLH
jgi:hypothetical protein